MHLHYIILLSNMHSHAKTESTSFNTMQSDPEPEQKKEASRKVDKADVF